MSNIAELLININANAGGVNKGVGVAVGALKKLESAVAGMGAGISMAGIVAGFKATADEMMNVYNVSQRLGVSSSALSTLGYVAKQNDVEFETLTTTLQKMQRVIGDVGRGQGQQALAALQQLGISAAQVSGGDAATQFINIATALASVSDATKKASIANDIFGKSWSSLAGFLNMTRPEYDALVSRAKELGAVMDESGRRDMAQYESATKDLDVAMKGLARSMSHEVVPAVTAGVSGLTSFLTNLHDSSKRWNLINDPLANMWLWISRGGSTTSAGEGEMGIRGDARFAPRAAIPAAQYMAQHPQTWPPTPFVGPPMPHAASGWMDALSRIASTGGGGLAAIGTDVTSKNLAQGYEMLRQQAEEYDRLKLGSDAFAANQLRLLGINEQIVQQYEAQAKAIKKMEEQKASQKKLASDMASSILQNSPLAQLHKDLEQIDKLKAAGLPAKMLEKMQHDAFSEYENRSEVFNEGGFASNADPNDLDVTASHADEAGWRRDMKALAQKNNDDMLNQMPKNIADAVKKALARQVPD